jgi:hypothetical protein
MSNAGIPKIYTPRKEMTIVLKGLYDSVVVNVVNEYPGQSQIGIPEYGRPLPQELSGTEGNIGMIVPMNKMRYKIVNIMNIPETKIKALPINSLILSIIVRGNS